MKNKQTDPQTYPYLSQAFENSLDDLKEQIRKKGKEIIRRKELRDNMVWYKGYLITEEQRDQLQNG